MSSSKSITKSASIIGSATLLSRILGFIRDVIIARFFGTGAIADAFFMAFSIPNLLRDLVGEGASDAAIVPVLTDELTKNGKEKFWEVAHALFKIFLVMLSAVTVLGVLFTPALVHVIAFGFKASPEKFSQTVIFTRMLFPFIFFIGMAAYGTGILSSLKHFTVTSLGPAVLNISIITFTVAFYNRLGIYALISGVLVGGALQFIIQIPVLLKKGFVPFRSRGFYHHRINKILKLMGPRAVGSCLYQVNFIVSRILASLQAVVGSGAVSALYYANRLFQFPLAIFAVSMAQASLPTMSEHVARQDIKQLKETLLFSLRNVFLISLPAASGLIFLRQPIIKIFFQRGEFNEYSTLITSGVLFYYLIGLFAVSGIKVLASCFYSLHDTRTPVKIAFFSLLINIIASLLLMHPMKVSGLALASTIAVIFNFSMLMVFLRRKIGSLNETALALFFLKAAVCAIITGISAYWLFSFACVLAGTKTRLVLAAVLMLTISISTFIFFILGKIARIEEVTKIARWILRKR